MKNYSTGLSSLLVWIFVPAIAHADVTLEQSVRVEARGLISVFESEKTVTTEISGNRGRIEIFDNDGAHIPDESAIINLKGDSAWTLYPDQQQYRRQSLAEKRHSEQRDMELISQVPTSGQDSLPIDETSCRWSRPNVALERTNQRKRIADIRAEQYLITATSTCMVPENSQICDVTWVLDYWNARRMPGDREVADFRRDLADQLGSTELLAMAPVVPRGLLELFEVNWQEVIYEADGLKGFPVKTVMSLHIGGKNCRTRSDEELTRDTVWSNVKQDSIQASKNQAAAQVGSAVAQQTARQVGGSFGGVVASTAMGILGRDAASKAMNKKKEEPEVVPVADENVTDRIAGQVQIFRITTELEAVNTERLSHGRLDIPQGWEEIPAN